EGFSREAASRARSAKRIRPNVLLVDFTAESAEKLDCRLRGRMNAKRSRVESEKVYVEIAVHKSNGPRSGRYLCCKCDHFPAGQLRNRSAQVIVMKHLAQSVTKPCDEIPRRHAFHFNYEFP